MESNAVDVYAAKERLRRDMRLLDAYAAGTPVYGIAKQVGMTSLEVAVQLRALLNDHAWLLAEKCPQIDAAATGSRIFEYLNARKISLPEPDSCACRVQQTGIPDAAASGTASTD